MPSSTQMVPAFPLLEARVGPSSSLLSVHLAGMCLESRTYSFWKPESYYHEIQSSCAHCINHLCVSACS